jgi:hypothetical protein
MSCISCTPEHHLEFAAEMIIHFPGLEGLDKPGYSYSHAC